MKKNKSSDCVGDVLHNDKNYEIKVSLGGKECNKFNYVQIRMNHACEYIFTAYYLCESNISNSGELFIFKLNKNTIKDLILKYGSYAHGTKAKNGEITEHDLDDINNAKEYCLRPKYGDKLWNELLTYRVEFADI